MKIFDENTTKFYHIGYVVLLSQRMKSTFESMVQLKPSILESQFDT